jgi:hypothetical protein
MHATLRGFQMIENMDLLYEALHKADALLEKNKEDIERRKRGEAQYRAILPFVQKENKSGYFTVISQFTLTLWVGLEAAVTDTVIAVMKNRPQILMEEPFSSIKITYGAFMNLDEQQLRYVVLSQIENRQEIKGAQGVDRLEKLLALANLSGPVSKKTKRDILELYAIRNLIVHRRGITDPTFRRICSWRRDQVGQPVKLSRRHFRRYEAATMNYVIAVANRLRTACGLKRVRVSKKRLPDPSTMPS